MGSFVDVIKEFYCPRCGHKMNTSEVFYQEMSNMYNIQVECIRCGTSFDIDEDVNNGTLRIHEYGAVYVTVPVK